MAAWLIIKTFFGGLFSTIFGDWHILVLVAVLGAAGGLYWKYHSMETDLNREKQNNTILRDNVSQLQDVNRGNLAVISQIQDDKRRSLADVADLSKKITASQRALDALNAKIDALTAKPVLLGPYFSTAITEIQQQRDAQNPPAPTVQPKPTIAERLKPLIPGASK